MPDTACNWYYDNVGLILWMRWYTVSFFDFLKRKPILDKSEKPFARDRLTGESVKPLSANILSFIKVNTEIISSPNDEIIPVEKRMKNVITSKHGLYPHEVLLLDYAPTYYTEGNLYPGFWWYSYGVRDVEKCLHSLLDRGFLKVGDLQSAINLENATVLKEELKKHGLKVSGKKDSWYSD